MNPQVANHFFELSSICFYCLRVGSILFIYIVLFVNFPSIVIVKYLELYQCCLSVMSTVTMLCCPLVFGSKLSLWILFCLILKSLWKSLRCCYTWCKRTKDLYLIRVNLSDDKRLWSKLYNNEDKVAGEIFELTKSSHCSGNTVSSDCNPNYYSIT